MRCPKCGYNSFDHLDSCKKCGKNLVEFKQTYGIKSVLFPGEMGVSSSVDEVEFDSVADAAVTAATGGEAVAAATVATADPVAAAATADDSDDFGFDFMGDSGDDDDLSFDELFEEAPEDEDIEETIEGPKAASEPEVKDEAEGDDFSFDLPDDDDTDLEDDFGFDPETDGAEKDADAAGTGEDPERPFDLPESSQSVGAPVASPNDQSKVSPIEEDGNTIAAPSSHLDTIGTEKTERYIFEEPSVPDDLPQSTTVAPVITETLAAEPVADASVQIEAAPAKVAPAEESVADFSKLGGPTPVKVASSISDSSDQIDLSLLETEEETADSHGTGSVAPSFSSSIGAFVCDLAVISIVAISFIVVAETAMSSQERHFFPSLETLVDLSIPYFLVIFFLSFGYFTLFHFLAGQTPGKMLAGLRVETVDGEPLAFAQAFLRSVGGLLQLLPAGVGYLLVLTSPDRRGWNDQLAGTRVVSLRSPSSAHS